VSRDTSLPPGRSGIEHGKCKSVITFHSRLCAGYGIVLLYSLQRGLALPPVNAAVVTLSCRASTCPALASRVDGLVQYQPYSFNSCRYYIHPPASLFSKPLLLVPEIQVQALLDEINATFRTSIKLPRDPFLLAFYQDSTPAPTLLGTSQSRDAVAKMEQEIPTASDEHGECPSDASPRLERSFLRFKEKTERAVAIQKKKSAAVKKSKAKDRLASQVNWCEALKRGQRYLGLRPVDCKGGLPLPDPSLSWDEQQRFEREQKLKHGHILGPFDVERPAPHPFDRDVVFISIDVEAFERAHNLITEVGISTLDTADIKLLPPGQGGVNWMECIRSRHFRVSNHSHLRNTTFCTGNPERFLFGHSEFASMDEVGKMVDSCFKPPYSAGFTHDGKYRPDNHTNTSSLQVVDQVASLSLTEEESVSKDVSKVESSNPPADVQRAASAEQYLAKNVVGSEIVPSSDILEAAPSSAGKTPGNDGSQEAPTTKDQRIKSRSKYRNIILIGHDLDSDLQYLSMLKSRVFHKPPAVTYPKPLESEDLLRQHILESLDTANLYQVWKRETNITSLAKVLVGVERTGWDLHNGGNDARYTMEAMVGILIRSRMQEDEVSRATSGDDFAQSDTGKLQTWEEEAEEKLTQSIRDKQEAVEREERENAAMWSHAMGSYGDRDALMMPEPYKPHPQDMPQPTDSPADTTPSHHAPTADTISQPPASYPWSSSPRATRDGGEPKGFAMPTPKSKGARVSPSSRRRDEVERLRDEGAIGGPCDWGAKGQDGW